MDSTQAGEQRRSVGLVGPDRLDGFEASRGVVGGRVDQLADGEEAHAAVVAGVEQIGRRFVVACEPAIGLTTYAFTPNSSAR